MCACFLTLCSMCVYAPVYVWVQTSQLQDCLVLSESLGLSVKLDRLTLTVSNIFKGSC